MRVNVELEAPSRRVKRIVHQKLGRQRAWGQADHNTIYIDPRCKGRKHLETVVHETIHILFPNLHEEEVEMAGAEIARVLWKLYYRRIDNDRSQPLQDE